MTVPMPWILPRLIPVAALIFGIACTTSGTETGDEPKTREPAGVADESASTTTTVEEPSETPSQSNARQKAADYLEFSSFSRSGLIDQLEFEGFGEADATYGVDALGVDWNEQAAAKAAEYLEFSSFSRAGLIEQLVFEGFTQAEAEHGVNTTGL